MYIHIDVIKIIVCRPTFKDIYMQTQNDIMYMRWVRIVNGGFEKSFLCFVILVKSIMAIIQTAVFLCSILFGEGSSFISDAILN